MSSILNAFANPAAYDGYQLQFYLLENIDLIGYCASFYLTIMGKGGAIFSWVYGKSSHARTEALLARQLAGFYTFSFFIHFLLGAVQFACVAVLSPMLLQSIAQRGFYATACVWSDALVYTGPAGLAITTITFSKIFEMLTTVSYAVRDFLLNKNTMVSTEGLRSILVQTHNAIRAPQWWYAVLIPLFYWHSYSIGLSTLPLLASVNAALRSASNIAMALEDLSLRAKLLNYIASDCTPAAAQQMKQRSPFMKAVGVVPGINMLLECLLCSAIALYSSFQHYTASSSSSGCAIMQANVRMCISMYLSALGLAAYQLHDMQKTKKTSGTAENLTSGKKKQ